MAYQKKTRLYCVQWWPPDDKRSEATDWEIRWVVENPHVTMHRMATALAGEILAPAGRDPRIFLVKLKTGKWKPLTPGDYLACNRSGRFQRIISDARFQRDFVYDGLGKWSEQHQRFVRMKCGIA